MFDRREALKMLGIGSTAGIMGMFGSSSSASASEKEAPSYARGMAPVKITGVRAIACAPAGSNLIVVRVDTLNLAYTVWAVLHSLKELWL